MVFCVHDFESNYIHIYISDLFESKTYRSFTGSELGNGFSGDQFGTAVKKDLSFNPKNQNCTVDNIQIYLKTKLRFSLAI